MMERTIKSRRIAAFTERIIHSQRMDVHDPLFNLREIAKNLILVEDHLSHSYKHCPDCIRKHLLCIEGLAEEATCLDTTGKYTVGLEGLAEIARKWLEEFTDGIASLELARNIRSIRKSLIPLSFDPRGMSERVASRHLLLKTCDLEK